MHDKSRGAAEQARVLYARSHQGALSTLSVEVSGYPFGSVVSFAPDAQGRPLLLLSRIAEHTRNIDADPRVSLILTEGGDDAQEGGRLTLLGPARRLVGGEADAGAARYYRRFPHARAYAQAHAFDLYVIEPLRLRYIGGFGRIHWLEVSALCRPNPFSAAVEEDMTRHMNEDHAPALRDYCRMAGVDAAGVVPRLAGVDADGFDLMLGKRLLRIDFDEVVATPDQVRKAMVALALQARQIGLRP